MIDSIGLDSTGVANSASPANDTTFQYTSLFERQATTVGDSLIGALIADGTKEYYTQNSTTTAAAEFPKVPQPYDQLSILVYLEDLYRLSRYLADPPATERPTAYKWPQATRLPEPDHAALAYPIVRREYVSAYCFQCYNPAFRAAAENDTDTNTNRYTALLTVYSHLLDPSMKQHLESERIIMAYEQPEVRARRTSERGAVTAMLARRFNDKALEQVGTRKEEQSARMQTLYRDLKVEARNRNYLNMERLLDDILEVQRALIYTFPVQDDIIEIFRSSKQYDDFPTYLTEKAARLNAYNAKAQPNGRIVAGPALAYAKTTLQATPLDTDERATLQTEYTQAEARLAELKAKQTDLKSLSTDYRDVLTPDETALLDNYRRAFQHDYNAWRRYVRDLRELLDVPPENSSFTYLLLQDRAAQERDKLLQKNLLTADLREQINALRIEYYEEVRAQEAVLAERMAGSDS